MKNLFFVAVFVFSIFTSFAQDRLAISHGPYLQHLLPTEVTILWTTNHDAVSWVELAPDDDTHFYLQERPKYFSAEFGFKDVGKVHVVRIETLLPETTYRYRIYSQEVLQHEGTKVLYGTTAATSAYSDRILKFTTPGKSDESVSFLMINDIHGKNEMMENLLNKGDINKADFVFFNGDMVSDFKSEDQLFGDFMDTAIRLFAKEKPMYYARGNHETRGNFANEFSNYFPSPNGRLYYLLRRGPVCFVVLDCGEDKPDSDIEYSGIVAFDQYRLRQAEWLKQAIKSPEYLDAPFKIAVVHMPPFGGWHGEEEVATRFVPLLNEAGIDLMFCGHLHKYIHQKPNEKCSFPVIANSNNAVVKANAGGGSFNLEIINEKGEIMDSWKIQK